MATSSTDETKSCGSTTTETVDTATEESTLVLKLRKAKASKKVGWTGDTVDNEHLNRKKSKCCCIYKKPHNFDESSSEEDEDECDNCSGHVEHKHRKGPAPDKS